MPDSLLPDPTRTAAPPAGSTTRNGEQLTAERTPGSTLSVPPEHLPRPFGRYELRQLLGRGGMGSVYLAHDAQLDRLVALKMPRSFGDDPTLWRERFLTEARAAATLSHPNICPVHDVGEHDGQPYLTMAYIDGETLAARLKRDGRLPVNEAVGLVATVARAMAEAHARGIVHRDLKPGNLLLDRRGRPVVTDFGLALRASTADDLRLTLTGVAMGTPAYMPPEQAGGDADAVGPASDVYALGVMLFELLTGRVPFRGRTFGQLLAQIERDPPPLPSSLADGVPPALDAVVLTALAKAPADRFPTAAEFADALDQFQAGHLAELTARYGAALAAADVTAPHPRPTPTPPRKRRWPAVAAGLLGFALLLLAGTVIYVRTDKGDLRVELSDPKADVRVEVNGQEVTLDPDGKPVRVRAGDNQKVVVSGADFETVSEACDLKRNGQSVVRVTLVPKGGVADLKKIGSPVGPPKPPPTPTRPVAFPKDKTLIEAGGWQILADATKEQMEVWLAERKKAKHSVLWLDLIVVDGKPLYAGVAATDDRLTDWVALPDVPGDDVVKMAPLRKSLDTTAYRIASVASYYSAADVDVRTSLLFHRRKGGWWLSPGYARDRVAKVVADNEAAGFRLRLMRPFPYGLEAFSTVYCEGGTEPTFSLLDGSEAELAKFLEEYRGKKYRPTTVAAAIRDGEVRFTAVVVPDPAGSTWEVERDTTAAVLGERTTRQLARGFTPASVTACPWDGAVRYCVVWVKEPPKPTPYPKDKVVVTTGGYETLLDATKEQMQTWLDERRKNKHSVTWLDVTAVGDKPVYSAVAALDDRQTNWRVFLDEPAVEHDQSSKELREVVKTSSFVALSGYPAGGMTRSAILLHPKSSVWNALPTVLRDNLDKLSADMARNGHGFRVFRPHAGFQGVTTIAVVTEPMDAAGKRGFDLSADGLTQFAADTRAAGHRLGSVTAYPADGGLKFAATSAPNPDKAEWAYDTDLPAAKLAEAAKEKAKAGFRPTAVTGYAWAGAIRYCVVWVKEPDKKPEPKKDEPKK